MDPLHIPTTPDMCPWVPPGPQSGELSLLRLHFHRKKTKTIFPNGFKSLLLPSSSKEPLKNTSNRSFKPPTTPQTSPNLYKRPLKPFKNPKKYWEETAWEQKRYIGWTGLLSLETGGAVQEYIVYRYWFEDFFCHWKHRFLVHTLPTFHWRPPIGSCDLCLSIATVWTSVHRENTF